MFQIPPPLPHILTRLILQAGTFAFLKNFRKGLRHQMARCNSQLAAATACGDPSAAQEAQHRLDWIFEKQRRLDVDHDMVHDKPSWHFGRELEYGSLQDDARRLLTAQEIDWNEVLFVDPRQAVSCLFCCLGVL